MRFLAIFTLILYAYLFYVYNFMFFCRWTDPSSSKIVLLADPQMEGHARVFFQGYFGHINNVMNDLYYRHIILNIQWYLKPEYVIVLGDLFSQQHLDDKEFAKRVERYNFIFEQVHGSHFILINMTGNHDIGYGFEHYRWEINRFIRTFGPTMQNLVVKNFTIAIIESLALDGSVDSRYQVESLSHLKKLKGIKNIILLTHVPLYKPKGSCVDDPTLSRDHNGNVYQQNMLSEEISDYIIKEIKPSIIFSGHDHEGCAYHHGNTTEITLKSIMGDFGGLSGMLEIHNDGGFYFQECSIGYIKYIVFIIILAVTMTFITCGSLASLKW